MLNIGKFRLTLFVVSQNTLEGVFDIKFEAPRVMPKADDRLT